MVLVSEIAACTSSKTNERSLGDASGAGDFASGDAIVPEPLGILQWSPTPGAVCVSVDATIQAVFSSDVDDSTLTEDSFYLQDDLGQAITVDRPYNTVSFTGTLIPDQPLAFDALYTATATTAVGGSGNVGALSTVFSTTFRTVPRQGCANNVECLLPSDCPSPQICSRIGTCINECLDDLDCFGGGTCTSQGFCSNTQPDGGPMPGDPPLGDAPAGGD